MPTARLNSIRWLKNHGVQLAFADKTVLYIPPNGAVTVGQAQRLMSYSQMRLYRLRDQKRVKFHRGAYGTSMVPLAELRRLRRNGTS